jgi:hypothetical protein
MKRNAMTLLFSVRAPVRWIVFGLCLISVVWVQPVAVASSTANVQATLTWSIEIVESVGDVGYDTYIALDSNEYPHISSYDITEGDLRYAKWTGSIWSTETVDSLGDVWYGSSIALDSSDNAHISYFDNINEDLKHAMWTGSAWNIYAVDSLGNVGTYNSIALDSNGNSHISYWDITNGDLKHAWWTGSVWSTETVDSLGIVGRYTSIVVDSSDNPHISYCDWTNRDLKYAWWTGSAWSTETVDASGDVGRYTSIALDSNNYPHISYWDFTKGDLKYAWWTGSAWKIEIVDDGNGDVVGSVSSIALDSDDNPHISYHDETNSDLKYAHGRVTYQYHFRATPYSNVFHVNIDASGWINGYMTGGPAGWNPVLGKIEGDKACMAVDVYPDETPGDHEAVFLTVKLSTMTGQFIATDNGMNYVGPYKVKIAFVDGSKGNKGLGVTEVRERERGSQVTQDAWYTLRINPYTDVVHININPGGWLNGYREPDHPVLGFYEGDRWYFAIDGLGTGYTLAFNTGSLSTLQGDMISTQDGTAYDGPHDIWLTQIN